MPQQKPHWQNSEPLAAMTPLPDISRDLRPIPGEPLHMQGKRLMERHYEAMVRGDMAEALAYWDRFAPYYFRHIVTHRQDRPHNFHLPSIFSSFNPKSVGTFLHNRCVHALGYSEFFWAITNPVHAQEVWASRSASRIYQLGGFTAHCHMLPEPKILGNLADIRDTPLWLHVRNPVDCVVASFHHYLGQAQGEGAVRDRRVAHNQAELQRMAIDLSDIDSFAERHIDFFIDWLAAWAGYTRQNPEDVIFSFFDELLNPQLLFTRILGLYGAACPEGLNFGQRLPEDRWRKPDDKRMDISSTMRVKLTDKTAKALKDFEHRDRILDG